MWYLLMLLFIIIIFIISGISSIIVVVIIIFIIINVIVIIINIVRMRVSAFTGDINRTASYWSFCPAYTFSIAAVAISSQKTEQYLKFLKTYLIPSFILQVYKNDLFDGAVGRNWLSLWINSK